MNSNITKKIVITGAGGFLGSNLVQALKRKEEYLVYAFSSRGKALQKGDTSSNIQYYHKDVVICDAGTEFLKDAIVVNCAFPRNSTGTEMADGLRYIQRLFDRAKESEAKAVINISSQSVYSQMREEPATEETPVCLENPYAVGKYAVELMLESVCRGTGVAYTNLRMASLIGPGFDQRIVNRLVKQALAGEVLHIVKSKQHFGFLDVEDAVSAIIATVRTGTGVWEPVYVVGNARSYTIDDIVKTIECVCSKERITFPDIDVVEGNGKGNTCVSYQLILKDLKFVPRVDLEESIRRILSSFKKGALQNDGLSNYLQTTQHVF